MDGWSVEVLRYALVVLIAYLLGAFPTGYIVGRIHGVDVRHYGSGRTGGTNVLRAAGAGAAILTVSGDLLKGVVAVLVARWVLHSSLAEAMAALLTIVGHEWSVFIGWHGGAGIITGAGTILVLSPLTVIILAPIGVIVLLIWRYASLGSLTVSTLAPIVLLGMVLFHGQPIEHWFYVVVAAGLIIFSHRTNIRRLLAGTERKIGEVRDG